MKIFQTHRFNEGSWESSLRSELKKRRIVANTDKVAGRKHWNATTTAWIQFESEVLRKQVSRDDDSPGPSFWMSKPAVMANKETLYAGYYVERGLETLAGTEKSPDYLMRGDWHWHLFMSTLNISEQRLALAGLMKRLPEENRGILFLRAPETEREYLTFIPYTDGSSLDEVESLISESEVNDWIDLILGVRFTLDECLARQDGIVDQLRAPLNLAVSIEKLILQASPIT